MSDRPVSDREPRPMAEAAETAEKVEKGKRYLRLSEIQAGDRGEGARHRSPLRVAPACPRIVRGCHRRCSLSPARFARLSRVVPSPRRPSHPPDDCDGPSRTDGASRHVPALSDCARAPIRLSRSDGRGTMQCRVPGPPPRSSSPPTRATTTTPAFSRHRRQRHELRQRRDRRRRRPRRAFSSPSPTCSPPRHGPSSHLLLHRHGSRHRSRPSAPGPSWRSP